MSKKIICLSIFLFLSAANIFAQTKSNDAVERQMKNLRVAQNFKLTYNPDSNMSKIMVVAEDFGFEDDRAAGVQGFSFGMAFFYQGKSLNVKPDEINLTFWVKTDKPRFAESHHLTITAGNETLDLGEARYAAKPSANMEYLNFKISPENLARIAAAPNAKMKIGKNDFTFTPQHLQIFSAIVKISDPQNL